MFFVATRRSPTTAALLIVLSIVTLASDARAADAPIVKSDIGRKLDEYLTRLSLLGFSGSAIVAHNGDVLLQKGYGLADRELSRPVTTDTIFTIGSITKQFTGAAVLKLEMMGKLSVDDPVSKYFGNVPDDKRSMTIHHLLTHTAGLPGALGDDFGGQATSAWLVEKALSSKLMWAPGTRYSYSNVGFSLAAIIVQKVSGMGYEQFLRQYIFEPAGMTRSGYVLPKFDDAVLAVGYRGDSRWGTILERPMLEDGPNWNLRGNGGIHSTPGERYRWHQALLGETILSAAAKKKYFANHVDEGGGDSYYGYGWSIRRSPWGSRVIEHNGGNGIFSADCKRFVDEGLFVYVCTSLADCCPVDPISELLVRIALGKRHEMPPKVVQLGAAQLQLHAGTYRFSDGPEVVVTVEPNRLIVRGTNPEGADLIAGRLSSRDPRVAGLLQKTEHLIGEWMNGDYDGLLAVWGGRMTKKEVRGVLNRIRERRTQDLGPFQGVESIGCESKDDMTVVSARVEHAHAAEGIDIGWRDGKLVMIGLTEGAPSGGSDAQPTRFFSLGGGRFESYSFRSQQGTRLEFGGDHDYASAGKLVLHAGSRTLEAARVE